jgi:hypothetical protein
MFMAFNQQKWDLTSKNGNLTSKNGDLTNRNEDLTRENGDEWHLMVIFMALIGDINMM